ncbi:MAG: TrkA family potassium uptake protein [Planctomycetes bacterium]|nr:TrkA family potassium uptake protein [Planctomycetota bacterium]
MNRFVVIGLGRFGNKLAIALSMSGAEVIAIDRDRKVVDEIMDHVAQAVRLDSTDEEALRSQGVDKVDAAIVGMGQGGRTFESAIMTVVNLKTIGVKKIYARAQSITSGQVFLAVGATEIIYPEIETAHRWAYRLIAPHIGDKIDFAPGYSLASLETPAVFDGKTVMELELRQKYKVNLVAIRRMTEGQEKRDKKAEIINVPLPSTIINAGDILMVAGSDKDLARLPQEQFGR